ncbi:hypothetical protein [Microbacterium sp. Se5.02b]|uniref:hypothetical protein n=1 Tax=Microbacterium sp. Se63.02b TaxID=2709304 RepID=UPI002867BEB9|nr:hypothetical protein [Microbacterium sp. Se5.02b]
MPEQLSARPLPVWAEPSAVFAMLEARASDVFWLDAGAEATEGWSFVGTGERSTVPVDTRLDVTPADDDASLPPFRGGWVGWLDYESGATAAGAPIAGPVDTTGGAWVRATHVVAFDHARRQTWALCDDGEIETWAADTLRAGAPAEGIAPPREDLGDLHLVAEPRHDPQEYEALIERCRDLIRAGIAYQLCLTTRFTVAGVHDPVAVYARLRSATPAHHGDSSASATAPC